MSFVENMFIVSNQLIVEMLFYTLLTLTMCVGAVRSGYIKLKLYFDRCASVVLGSLGLRLLINRD